MVCPQKTLPSVLKFAAKANWILQPQMRRDLFCIVVSGPSPDNFPPKNAHRGHVRVRLKSRFITWTEFKHNLIQISQIFKLVVCLFLPNPKFVPCVCGFSFFRPKLHTDTPLLTVLHFFFHTRDDLKKKQMRQSLDWAAFLERLAISHAKVFRFPPFKIGAKRQMTRSPRLLISTIAKQRFLSSTFLPPPSSRTRRLKPLLNRRQDLDLCQSCKR